MATIADYRDARTPSLRSARSKERSFAHRRGWYCTIDRDLRLMSMGPRVAAWMQPLPDPPIGRKLHNIVPGLKWVEFSNAVQHAIETLEPIHLPNAVQGRRVDVECYPWRDGAGCFFQDVSDEACLEQEAQTLSATLFKETLDALSIPIVIVNEKGEIAIVNRAWRDFVGVERRDTQGAGVGKNYIDACRSMICEADFARLRGRIDDVIKRKSNKLDDACCCEAGGSLRYLEIHIRRCGVRPNEHLLVSHEDVTERKNVTADLHALSGRLLTVQDEERRRIARDLHDNTAQNLVAALMEIDLMRGKAVSNGEVVTASEKARALVNQALSEIRTLSYLMHPPLLDELGLAMALKLFARGFERRSGIAVALDVPEPREPIPAPVATMTFRIVQEALTNIYRHSESATAEVRLVETSNGLVLTVSDSGRGLSHGAASIREGDILQLGTGLAGMRARLRQLGGEVAIGAGGQGTLLTATIPAAALQNMKSERAAPPRRETTLATDPGV